MTIREEPSRNKAGQNHQEHQVNREEGHMRNSEDKDYLEARWKWHSYTEGHAITILIACPKRATFHLGSGVGDSA
jgi:hypothetical protein